MLGREDVGLTTLMVQLQQLLLDVWGVLWLARLQLLLCCSAPWLQVKEERHGTGLKVSGVEQTVDVQVVLCSLWWLATHLSCWCTRPTKYCLAHLTPVCVCCWCWCVSVLRCCLTLPMLLVHMLCRHHDLQGTPALRG
jgi:hypothetical protein